MINDLIEIEAFCQSNNCCFDCPYEDECWDSLMVFGYMHAKEWMQHFTRIIYAEGE